MSDSNLLGITLSPFGLTGKESIYLTQTIDFTKIPDIYKITQGLKLGYQCKVNTVNTDAKRISSWLNIRNKEITVMQSAMISTSDNSFTEIRYGNDFLVLTADYLKDNINLDLNSNNKDIEVYISVGIEGEVEFVKALFELLCLNRNLIINIVFPSCTYGSHISLLFEWTKKVVNRLQESVESFDTVLLNDWVYILSLLGKDKI